jgi:hypothetical protein
MGKLRIGTVFSGIGAPEQGLERLPAPVLRTIKYVFEKV